MMWRRWLNLIAHIVAFFIAFFAYLARDYGRATFWMALAVLLWIWFKDERDNA